MARQQREEQEVTTELDLAPFMNMVVILIPMLLLSVVFIKIGVINITAPKLSVGPPSETEPEKEEEPLNLTVAVSSKGFRIAATGATLPEMDGCPKPGPTICLEDQSVDVAQKVEDAREAFASGNKVRGEKLLSEALNAYDFRRLYNRLAEIKEKYPDETVVNLSADSDLPYSVLVRVMDTVRYKLDKNSYGSTSDFWAASVKQTGGKPAELFPDPVLAVVQ